jgi:hypothetical protein
MAAIRAYYAARIAAARGGLPASAVAAAVKVLLNEEIVALRALAERWRAATERQRTEKPRRPVENVRTIRSRRERRADFESKPPQHRRLVCYEPSTISADLQRCHLASFENHQDTQ